MTIRIDKCDAILKKLEETAVRSRMCSGNNQDETNIKHHAMNYNSMHQHVAHKKARFPLLGIRNEYGPNEINLIIRVYPRGKRYTIWQFTFLYHMGYFSLSITISMIEHAKLFSEMHTQSNPLRRMPA